MSSRSSELELLRAEVLAVQAEVIRLRARVAALEEERFELVEGPASTTSAGSTQPAPSIPAAATSPQVSREEVCGLVGRFLRRSLEGSHRGTSSRDLLPLASRFWIVVRSFDGAVYDPPRVFSKFGSCKALVKRGGDVGDSVFVGLPAQKDVVECLRAGGFGEPLSFEG